MEDNGMFDRKGGWIYIGGIMFPFVNRNQKKYVSVYMVEQKLLSKYPSEKCDAINEMPPLTSFRMTDDEAKFLNSINVKLCRKIFGEKEYKAKEDLIVSVVDMMNFVDVVKKCFPDVRIKNDVVLCLLGGWMQINNTVVPYVLRENERYLPYQVLHYAASLLVGVNVETDHLGPFELYYLNNLCKKAGMTYNFENNTEILSLKTVMMHHKNIITKDLPQDNPFQHAVYIAPSVPVIASQSTSESQTVSALPSHSSKAVNDNILTASVTVPLQKTVSNDKNLTPRTPENDVIHIEKVAPLHSSTEVKTLSNPSVMLHQDINGNDSLKLTFRFPPQTSRSNENERYSNTSGIGISRSHPYSSTVRNNNSQRPSLHPHGKHVQVYPTRPKDSSHQQPTQVSSKGNAIAHNVPNANRYHSLYTHTSRSLQPNIPLHQVSPNTSQSSQEPYTSTMGSKPVNPQKLVHSNPMTTLIAWQNSNDLPLTAGQNTCHPSLSRCQNVVNPSYTRAQSQVHPPNTGHPSFTRAHDRIANHSIIREQLSQVNSAKALGQTAVNQSSVTKTNTQSIFLGRPEISSAGWMNETYSQSVVNNQQQISSCSISQQQPSSSSQNDSNLASARSHLSDTLAQRSASLDHSSKITTGILKSSPPGTSLTPSNHFIPFGFQPMQIESASFLPLYSTQTAIEASTL